MLPNLITNQQNLKGGVIALLLWDETLFDGMHLPDGIEKDDVVNYIVGNYGKTPLMHPYPDYMKFYIETWSKRRLPIWKKLLETLSYEYNPIHNYDRTETYTDTIDDERNNTYTGENVDNGSVSTEHKVSAYNSSTYQPENMDEQTLNNTTNTNSETGETFNRTFTHKANVSGNIGVTTTQRMIEEQRDIVNYSVIEEIGKDFVKEFCLYVW